MLILTKKITKIRQECQRYEVSKFHKTFTQFLEYTVYLGENYGGKNNFSNKKFFSGNFFFGFLLFFEIIFGDHFYISQFVPL